MPSPASSFLIPIASPSRGGLCGYDEAPTHDAPRAIEGVSYVFNPEKGQTSAVTVEVIESLLRVAASEAQGVQVDYMKNKDPPSSLAGSRPFHPSL